MNTFIFELTPKPLNEDVVHEAVLAVHRDLIPDLRRVSVYLKDVN